MIYWRGIAHSRENILGYYIFNQLYLNEYASWVQSVPVSHLQSLASAIHTCLRKSSKKDLKLDLEELETAAHLTLAEERDNELRLVTSDLSKCDLDDGSDDDDDDSTDLDSDDDES